MNKTSLIFLSAGLIALMIGMLFGVLAGVQYILPDFIKESVPFSNLRPFHVTSVISWIILAAVGGVYYYISKANKNPISNWIPKLHVALFIITGLLIYYSYFTKKFGGKEYLEFPPYLILPIIFGWILFGMTYFRKMRRTRSWPVYYWMWATGIVMMIYHLSEAYLWLNPEIGNNFIKALTIQWKAGGSFVGAWNMLVYGTAIYLMSKISGNDSIGRNKLSFFFYFLGLTNLMFGWAHHIYIVPTAPWIRAVSYAISMTEWIILFHMIYQWRNQLPQSAKYKYLMPSKFLAATDFWIFLNLILALLFSIPAINFFTHGTHITVAHSMGTTIGINTTILLASLLYIAKDVEPKFDYRRINPGFKIFNFSLFFFWLSLLAAGIRKSIWMYFTSGVTFRELQSGQHWIYVSFLIFGIGIFVGISMIAVPLLSTFIRAYFMREPKPQHIVPVKNSVSKITEEVVEI